MLFGIRRVVMGENETFVGGEDVLKGFGVDIVNLGEWVHLSSQNVLLFAV